MYGKHLIHLCHCKRIKYIESRCLESYSDTTLCRRTEGRDPRDGEGGGYYLLEKKKQAFVEPEAKERDSQKLTKEMKSQSLWDLHEQKMPRSGSEGIEYF